ncbi:eukaryotic translation initiation factor 4E, putative [Entamoeba histolytica HM-1:IMSS-B]|uniref:Eukaryotic translation initiation factor 4E, putative n=6 Tax=Entamoeba histolytica TaxID=5759 RepID=C4M2F7_ENTH1|nr:eukaryotic translation initiation factor 4E, putative [Entamoeba histolytica HM-1:IMSS]EMD43351.1 eukaryotic translation initiation factor 4E, putative [Entamoeba histolytica KU27]EMH73331.1 eukaryotic translation initiation factor 4E, putative [Entamoeba histolytica HM-1:IMSS-B]EMS15456.1 eukaryotic translation initiation factor 4E, putative [Entamoeba histolytica HM-3:IMSS]ENY65806.1 eukaryotic translation initiation factor 4E, putative [Entamoeba histolytica HM-1:IMSS-A]GAT95459.1 eukary|eukprot:XP_648900.2 eukaryotic translation initiation factor 4E, putative [Entamoeba histolytica HM-1:IMSS]
MTTTKEIVPVHFLTTGWTYWFDLGINQVFSTSGVTATPIYTTHSVEEFWGLYDSIEKQTTLPKGIDSFFFRSGIEPKTTENGGKLQFNLQINTSSKAEFAEDVWLKLMLSCIGETIPLRDKVNGVSFSLRSFAKLTVWLKTDKEDDLRKVISFMRTTLNIPTSIDFHFFSHRGKNTTIKELN